MRFHCLFEQSGTFKNELKKLGYDAYDYDILNDFNQTDYQIDLFNEIHEAYRGEQTIFDNIDKDDVILAFFPCVRFEQQILLWFRGEAMQQKNWQQTKKLEHCLKLHQELSNNYDLITKLAIVCLNKGLKLVIENPYNDQHYLTRYWCIKPTIIDKNRRSTGDFYKKPTQYWFINFEPENNLIFEPVNIKPKKTISGIFGQENFKVERSMISTDYANRFIREFLIKE